MPYSIITIHDSVGFATELECFLLCPAILRRQPKVKIFLQVSEKHLWPPNTSRTCTCSVRKMSRISYLCHTWQLLSACFSLYHYTWTTKGRIKTSHSLCEYKQANFPYYWKLLDVKSKTRMWPFFLFRYCCLGPSFLRTSRVYLHGHTRSHDPESQSFSHVLLLCVFRTFF